MWLLGEKEPQPASFARALQLLCAAAVLSLLQLLSSPELYEMSVSKDRKAHL